jgi:anti-anti-sigma factor
MGSSQQQDNLTAAFAGHTVVIQVEGRGSFRISPSLKQFVHRITHARAASRVLIDMSCCGSMDSTFMGVLAGLSYQLKDSPGHDLKLIKLSDKNRKLLATLGVDQVVKFSQEATDEEEALLHELGQARPVEPDTTGALTAAKTSLEAHETLVNLNPENLDKFRSVLELLQKDIDKLNHP